MYEAKQSSRLDPPAIDFVCTDTEIRAGVHLIGRTKKWGDRITVLCAMSLMGVYCYRQPPGDRVVFLSIFGVLGIAYFAWRFWPKRPSSEPEKCTLSETGIRIKTSSLVLELSYSSFTTCLESAEIFLLLDPRKKMPVVLPKRIFPNEEWQNWFRARLGK